jgi:hypothetical protein
MKAFLYSLIMFLQFSSAGAAEKVFSASTPANNTVRNFIGIPLSDSVDFIRWRLTINGNHYDLQCNYGIGQPNTNGFIDGGIKTRITGECLKQARYFQFKNGSKLLEAIELNDDLFHLVDASRHLLIGTGGWSYTINNIAASKPRAIVVDASPALQVDSMVYAGRTPCNIPGQVPRSPNCYKLKWLLVLYFNADKKTPGSFKLMGTLWRPEGGNTGTWEIKTSAAGGTFYQLNDNTGNGHLYLLKLDENILVFADADGNAMVGNADFSYTLNAKQ